MKVLVTEKGQITATEKSKLTAKGIIVIEAADVSKVKLLETEYVIAQSDMVLAALKGVSESNSISAKEIFVKELYDRLKSK